MLAVISIIVILITATLPALHGFMQAQSRHAGVSAVMATLDRARMMAIADGQSTYVVFLASSPPPAGVTISTDAFGRAYAIFEDQNNVNFQPVQRTPWMYLPAAMAFKVNSSTAGTDTTSITDRPLDNSATSTDPLFPVSRAVLASGGASSASVRLPYLKFDGTGAVDLQNPEYLRVLMFPGVVTASGASATELATQTTGSGATPSVLLEEIDLNLATGRARYVVDPASNLASNQ